MLEHVPSVPITTQTAGAPASRTATPSISGARFQALLEKLQASASELEAHADSAIDAKGLSKAVETAQESLEDALTLKDELLEAFRAEQCRPPTA